MRLCEEVSVVQAKQRFRCLPRMGREQRRASLKTCTSRVLRSPHVSIMGLRGARCSSLLPEQVSVAARFAWLESSLGGVRFQVGRISRGEVETGLIDDVGPF